MTATTTAPATWSAWAEANDEQRTYFKTLAHHRAWSRTCGGCGEGDFIERKQMPTNPEQALAGRRIPVLPEVIEEGGRPGRYRAPAHRNHVCAPKPAARR